MPKDILSLLGVLLILLLVLGGCCVFPRWAGSGLAGGSFGPAGRERRMRVVERLAVGRDQTLLVVELAGRYLLLGSSPSGFSLLAELTEEEGALWNSTPASDGRPGRAPLDFQDWMRKFREKK